VAESRFRVDPSLSKKKLSVRHMCTLDLISELAAKIKHDILIFTNKNDMP
jgi:hypothetical protein